MGPFKLTKSPIPWCTLLGMIVGYLGIPVFDAGYAQDTVAGWVWDRPYGFHIASIAILGTLGFLVGLVFHYGFRKPLDRRAAVWITSISSVVLALGIIGIFRYQAEQESVMWTKVNRGFSDAWAVSTEISRGDRNTPMQGYYMIRAGADIQAGASMGGIERFGHNRYQELSAISSAFSEAGYFMVSQKNTEKLKESNQFVHKSGSIIRQMVTGDQSYPKPTNHFNEVISKIDHDIPNDYGRPGAWNQ